MKKLVYGAALLMVAAGSFAFLPKEADAPKYMMLVANPTNRTLFTISPEGLVQGGKVNLEAKSGILERLQVRQAELATLNDLRKLGWVIIQQQTADFPSGMASYSETTTLLEHP